MIEKPKRDLVIMGVKPIMNYVVACMTLFNDGNDTVRIRARGKHINKAVDTVQLLRRVFLRDLVVRKSKIGTDLLIRDDGNEAKVSTIEIVIASS
ncbi:DNA-binding protein Alba [Candidatus Bathyarchaeota archaeon]|jgi:archaea-specific DNA-binding protein|nr:DNA-binding protein Alba [Candidatus Bathyarchaeota archaeon]